MLLTLVAPIGCAAGDGLPGRPIVTGPSDGSVAVRPAPVTATYELWSISPRQSVCRALARQCEPVGFNIEGGHRVAFAGDTFVPIAAGQTYVWHACDDHSRLPSDPSPDRSASAVMCGVAGVAAHVGTEMLAGWARSHQGTTP
jgi:hypothetical protein